MSERDHEVERIVERAKRAHLEDESMLLEDVLREAIKAARELGRKDISDGPCMRAEAYVRGLRNGARRMQERCVALATKARETCAEQYAKQLDHFWAGAEREAEEIRAAILALKPEDV